jgi:hypothetical protein
MNGLTKKFNPIFAILALLSVGGFRTWNDSRVKAEKQAEEYNDACVDDVTQTQDVDLPKEQIEKLGYFKVPRNAENFRSEISVQFPNKSRFLSSKATYVRMSFRIRKKDLESWKPTLKLTKSSSEPTGDNGFARMESRAWRQMIECKQDWWTPTPAEQSYRNFKDHPGAWLFDFSSSKDDPEKVNIFVSGFMNK